LDDVLRDTLQGAQRIAMEYSPRGEVPYVSYVDAGTVERVRACGVEVVSSADLLQHFLTWNDEDWMAHEEAVRTVIRAKDLAFQLIDASPESAPARDRTGSASAHRAQIQASG
jgi:hypothetical protein